MCEMTRRLNRLPPNLLCQALSVCPLSRILRHHDGSGQGATALRVSGGIDRSKSAKG
jgi:hypothetical protein